MIEPKYKVGDKVFILIQDLYSNSISYKIEQDEIRKIIYCIDAKNGEYILYETYYSKYREVYNTLEEAFNGAKKIIDKDKENKQKRERIEYELELQAEQALKTKKKRWWQF